MPANKIIRGKSVIDLMIMMMREEKLHFSPVCYWLESFSAPLRNKTMFPAMKPERTWARKHHTHSLGPFSVCLAYGRTNAHADGVCTCKHTHTLKGIMCQTLSESKERNFLLELCSRGLLPSCSYTRTSTRMIFPFTHLASPTFVKTARPPMALNCLQSLA